MKIHFYEVKDCTYDMVQGIPAIFAPEGVDTETLQRHFFIQTLDGRWFHYLTREEYYYLMSFSGSDEVVFRFDRPVTNYYPPNYMPYAQNNAQDENKANTMCGISLGLIGLGFLISSVAPALTFPCWIAALVLMIIVRVNHPQNTFGKVLMIIYIVFGVLFFIGILLAMAACGMITGEILDSCNNIPG